MQSNDTSIASYDRDLPMSLNYHTWCNSFATLLQLLDSVSQKSCKLKILYVVPHNGRKSDDMQ